MFPRGRRETALLLAAVVGLSLSLLQVWERARRSERRGVVGVSRRRLGEWEPRGGAGAERGGFAEVQSFAEKIE